MRFQLRPVWSTKRSLALAFGGAEGSRAAALPLRGVAAGRFPPELATRPPSWRLPPELATLPELARVTPPELPRAMVRRA